MWVFIAVTHSVFINQELVFYKPCEPSPVFLIKLRLLVCRCKEGYGCGADSGGVPDVRLGAGEDSGDGEIWMNDVGEFWGYFYVLGRETRGRAHEMGY